MFLSEITSVWDSQPLFLHTHPSPVSSRCATSDFPSIFYKSTFHQHTGNVHIIEPANNNLTICLTQQTATDMPAALSSCYPSIAAHYTSYFLLLDNVLQDVLKSMTNLGTQFASSFSFLLSLIMQQGFSPQDCKCSHDIRRSTVKMCHPFPHPLPLTNVTGQGMLCSSAPRHVCSAMLILSHSSCPSEIVFLCVVFFPTTDVESSSVLT